MERSIRTGYSGQRQNIGDTKRNHRTGKPVGKGLQKEADGAQVVLEDKNRLLKEAELLDQLFDSYGQVLSHLKEKTAEKAKYELMKEQIQSGKSAERVRTEEKRYLEEEKRLTELKHRITVFKRNYRNADNCCRNLQKIRKRL